MLTKENKHTSKEISIPLLLHIIDFNNRFRSSSMQNDTRYFINLTMVKYVYNKQTLRNIVCVLMVTSILKKNSGG